MKITVLQGVPASGKSTYAQQLVEKDLKTVIVSRDAIREGKGIYWENSHEKYVSEIEEFQIRSAIKNGFNVVIDATNLNPKTVDKWIDLASELEVDIEFKLFQISYADALIRDKNRKRQVGPAVMTNFFKNYFPHEPLVKPQIVEKDERKISEQDENLRHALICDIDGTIALRVNRSPYNYSKVDTDVPNPYVLKTVKRLAGTGVHPIFITGRKSTKTCMEKTRAWLDRYFGTDYTLFMRTDGDNRHDDVIKREIYERHIKDHNCVLAVFEDRDRVVKMWRDLGLNCNQVYYGNF